MKGHNDYLDPDLYYHEGLPGPDPEPAPHGWVLSQINLDGTRTVLGTFLPYDGQDVMGCDMHQWMLEHEHYGDLDPENYDWDGDRESVAIMSKKEGYPDFYFEWIPIA